MLTRLQPATLQVKGTAGLSTRCSLCLEHSPRQEAAWWYGEWLLCAEGLSQGLGKSCPPTWGGRGGPADVHGGDRSGTKELLSRDQACSQVSSVPSCRMLSLAMAGCLGGPLSRVHSLPSRGHSVQ